MVATWTWWVLDYVQTYVQGEQAQRAFGKPGAAPPGEASGGMWRGCDGWLCTERMVVRGHVRVPKSVAWLQPSGGDCSDGYSDPSAPAGVEGQVERCHPALVPLAPARLGHSSVHCRGLFWLHQMLGSLTQHLRDSPVQLETLFRKSSRHRSRSEIQGVYGPLCFFLNEHVAKCCQS